LSGAFFNGTLEIVFFTATFLLGALLPDALGAAFTTAIFRAGAFLTGVLGSFLALEGIIYSLE
jgi:hypothetical protein